MRQIIIKTKVITNSNFATNSLENLRKKLNSGLLRFIFIYPYIYIYIQTVYSFNKKTIKNINKTVL